VCGDVVCRGEKTYSRGRNRILIRIGNRLPQRATRSRTTSACIGGAVYGEVRGLRAGSNTQQGDGNQARDWVSDFPMALGCIVKALKRCYYHHLTFQPFVTFLTS
jgi:hypothetical protein